MFRNILQKVSSYREKFWKGKGGMKRELLWLLMAGALFGIVRIGWTSIALVRASDGKEPGTFVSGMVASEFPSDVRWINTERVPSLAALRGKFVLLDFWTYGCINCMHILPDLQKLEQEFPVELVVLGIHSAKFQNEKQDAHIESAISRNEIHHPVANDSDFRIWKAYGVRAWPTIVLINPRGEIIAKRSGEGVYDAFQPIIAEGVDYFRKLSELSANKVEAPQRGSTQRGSSKLSYPGKISADAPGRRLFISDTNHNRIVIVDLEGKIQEIVGSGQSDDRDGEFSHAALFHPQGTTYADGTLYIADTGNNAIKAADIKSRKIRTLFRLDRGSPWDVAVQGSTLFIAMAGHHQIWRLDLRSLAAEPFAGTGEEALIDGKAGDSAFAQPSGLSVFGSRLFVADSESSSIRFVELNESTQVTTLIGKGLFTFGDVDGVLSQARLQHPLAVFAKDKILIVADTYNSKIKVVDLKTERISSVRISKEVPGKEVSVNDDRLLDEPGGLAAIGDDIFVADTNHNRIQKVNYLTGRMAPFEIMD